MVPFCLSVLQSLVAYQQVSLQPAGLSLPEIKEHHVYDTTFTATFSTHKIYHTIYYYLAHFLSGVYYKVKVRNNQALAWAASICKGVHRFSGFFGSFNL